MLIDLFLFVFLAFSILLVSTFLINLLSGVPYVPTPYKVVRRMIEIAKIKKGDKVYDLGCGDGRLVLEAEKITKTGGVGYELAPIPYLIALAKAKIQKSKSTFHLQSLFKADLSETDVLFCYLMPHMLRKLSKKITKECKKGTRIISHGFKIEGLTPKKIYKRDSETKLPTIYYYEI